MILFLTRTYQSDLTLFSRTGNRALYNIALQEWTEIKTTRSNKKSLFRVMGFVTNKIVLGLTQEITEIALALLVAVTWDHTV